MNEDVIEAINDLTRVIIAMNGGFTSKNEGIRRLHELSIPNGRIAGLLGLKTKDVASYIAKLKKRRGTDGEKSA